MKGLVAACAAVLLWSAGCASPCTDDDACGARAAAPVALSAGVYMLRGHAGAADAANLGRIGNSGFIVGPQGVLVIDTGTSADHGRAILAAVRSVTDRPVRLALVTHTRPEFLFGGSAMRERGIPVAMHAKAALLMAARCETCLKQLRQALGDAPMRDTAMYVPDRRFEASHTVEAIGRPVRVLYFGHSSGPGDIAVFDETSGVLFAGGLLDLQRIPDIQDGEIETWQRALGELRALGATTIVPGHGPAGAAEVVVGGVERYLAQLVAGARALVAAGTSLLEVPDAIELAEFSRWDQYDTIHRRNASIAFLRFEREQFFRQAGREETRP